MAKVTMNYDKLRGLMGKAANTKWPWLLNILGLPADTTELTVSTPTTSAELNAEVVKNKKEKK